MMAQSQLSPVYKNKQAKHTRKECYMQEMVENKMQF